MREALARVLADPVFERSPVLRRLLDYLVEQSLNGYGETLKSLTVAVDGLGKSIDDGPSADNYARVQVGRLRKALETFYAGPGRHRPRRLAIASGGYTVRLIADVTQPAETQDTESSPEPTSNRWLASPVPLRWKVCIGILVLVFAVYALLHFSEKELRESAGQWSVNDFPTVEVTVANQAADLTADDASSFLRQMIILKLSKYEGIDTQYNSKVSADYTVKVDMNLYRGEVVINVFVIEVASGRTVWSFAGNGQERGNETDLLDEAAIDLLAFQIAQTTGVIHSYGRKQGYEIGTPYGCWLRFTALLQSKQLISDDRLEECAKNWYVHAEDHPVAAALYGWTLLDQSISDIIDFQRRLKLEEALNVIETAKGLNPNSPLLQVAALRAYALTGDQKSMLAAGKRALKLNPGSLDIQGLVGTMFTLSNEPGGAEILKNALARHFNPPAWFFIGVFFDAMMREDAPAAKEALVGLEDLEQSQAVVPMLTAAYHARTGQLPRARAAWQTAKDRQPVLNISPDVYFQRLPIAPEVRSRLKQWLAPVLDPDQASQ